MKNKVKLSKQAGIGTPNVGATHYTSKANEVSKIIGYTGTGLTINTVNTYPNKLSELLKDSSTHQACINLITNMIYAKGINTELLLEDGYNELYDFMTEGLEVVSEDNNETSYYNPNRNTINKLYKSIAKDYSLYGGFAIKVKFNDDKRIVSLEYLDFKNVRVDTIELDSNKTTCYVSNNWNNKMELNYERNYSLPIFNPNNIEYIEVNDGIELKDEQILYFIANDCISSTSPYPTPRYSGAIDSVLAETLIRSSSLNAIRNGVNGTTFISVDDTSELVSSDEQINESVDNIISSMTGVSNSNGVMIVPKDAVFHSIEPISQDVFTNTYERAERSILMSHNVPKELLGNNDNSSFLGNNGELIKTSYALFYENTIKGYQDEILDVLNQMLIPFIGESKDSKIKLTLNEDNRLTNPFSSEDTEFTIK